MIEPVESRRPSQRDGRAPEEGGDGEVLDALPVLAEAHGPSPQRRSFAVSRDRGVAMMPAVQAVAVAAGGFVAGAAVLGLVHRHRRRSPAPAGGRGAARGVSRGRGRKGKSAVELLQVVGSRSLLVDVHLLGVPGVDR